MTASPLVHAILICLVCVFSYSNTFHVPFQFDDPYNISEKAYVKDINAFLGAQPVEKDSSFIMRTVTYFTFALNYRIHGNEVVGYHVVNLAIHLINGFLVYFLVLLTFKTPYFSDPTHPGGKVTPPPSAPPLKVRANSRPDGAEGRGSYDPRGSVGSFIALFTALLFVSHPVQTQAVTYIVQRLASLTTLFYLLSLVMYIKWRVGAYRDTPLQAGTKNAKSGWRSTVWYLSSLISAVLAMKTKEIAFTLPLMIALYEFLFFDGALKKRVLYLVPLLLTMLIIPLSLMGMSKPVGEIIGDVSEATKIGSTLTRWEYLFTEFRVIVTYVRLLIFPVGQNLDYDYPVYHSFFDPNVALSFLFLSALFGTGVYLLYKSRATAPGKVTPPLSAPPLKIRANSRPDGAEGRGSYDPSGGEEWSLYRLVAFGIFWFFMTLSVESGIISIADVIFEHRLYLPSVGFFIATSALLWMVWQRIEGHGKWVRTAALGMCGLFIVILSGLTYMRNTVWRTEIGLWEDVAAKSPTKARSYNGLGLAYEKEGRIDEALERFARAVAIDPAYAVAYNSLGSAYFKKNLFGRSVEEFSRAIALEPGNAIFRNNRGLAYAALGENDRAIADYREAIALDSMYDDPHHNLGSVLHGKGLYERAVEEYTKAITLETDNAIYYNNRGLSFSSLLEFEKAIADYTRAVAFAPYFADAYMGRGVAYGQLGRLDKAHEDLDRAISLDPSKVSSYINRAVVHERMQDIASALSDFQKACELGDERGCGGVEYLRKKYQAGK